MPPRLSYRSPPLGRIRLADRYDVPHIMNLINTSMANTFRIHSPDDIVRLLETGVLSICQQDIANKLVGFLCVKDYPVIPSIHPNAWEEYIWTKYKSIELNARNTLFLHLLCWNPIYAREIVDNMLKSVFMHDPYIHHIAMVKTLLKYPLLVPGQSRSEGGFRRVQAMERGIPGDALPLLCVADRTEISPRLRIRRAVEEDNDDIVPIIERHNPRLQELYGEFYVSELISRHPESERVLLVCEHKEVAVGVMCLNAQINYEALEENFELSPFAGLRHLEIAPKALRDLSRDFESVYSPSVSHIAMDPSTKESTYYLDFITPLKKSRVTWIFDDDDFKEFRKESTAQMPMSTPISQLDILSQLEDEEAEMEYDIVNIDADLLRVPKILNYQDGPADNILKMLDCKKKESIIFDEKLKEKIKSFSITRSVQGATIKPQEPTRYSGPPNAFLLELFAMDTDYDERYGFDMLEAAFELFPNRDYCVICLPSNHTSFPLLEHFTLVTPFGCRLKYINETLYVAHINSVRGHVRVRPSVPYDIAEVCQILEHAPRSNSLLDLFDTALASNSLDSFILLAQEQPIGVVILGPLEDGTAIRTHYALDPEPLRPGSDGTVLACVMSPVMTPHGHWYMRELLRQSRYSSLFWICQLFAKGDASPSRNQMSLAGRMTPVRPRRSVPNITGNKELDNIFKDVSIPFALWILERPLTSLPKVLVNNSIVVVGASRTGLSFIETLIMGPTSKYLTFTNITLVSEHGLPTISECLEAADNCVPRVGRYTDRYLKSVPFYYYVDVISSAMTYIDRKKKCIKLKTGGYKYYDELVLTCGHQFQHPDYLAESLELVKEVRKGKPCDRILMDNPKYQPDRVPPPPEVPNNLMLINSLFDANICFRKLLLMVNESKHREGELNESNQIIVYGECLEAYSCITGLLELGLDAENITFVEPFPPDDVRSLRVNCFNNEMVDERVQMSLGKIGIRVLRKCCLAGWRQQGNRVISLRLMSTLHAIDLPCFALFYYGLKAIDLYAFKAINESGLVYDGGLIIGQAFETNDPHIFAAGPCVKYSRILYAERQEQKYYYSEDVGEALAKMFLQKLDPFVMCNPNADKPDVLPRYHSSFLTAPIYEEQSKENTANTGRESSRYWKPVMHFQSPIVQSAILPGPLFYMNVRRPGPRIPMEVQLCLPHQGHILETDKRGNYFRLRLNALHCIEDITCLTKKKFSSEILSQLYGNHEAFFNRLLDRYMANQITDLFDYFTQPWMSALYQETFDDMLSEMNEKELYVVHDFAQTKYPADEHKPKSKEKVVVCNVPCCGVGAKAVPTKGDIPSECGQPNDMRVDMAATWKEIDGDEIVTRYLRSYLDTNNVINPHYAGLPKPEHAYDN